MYLLPPIYEYENFLEIGTKLLNPISNDTVLRNYLSKYFRLVRIKLEKEKTQNGTTEVDIRFIEFILNGLEQYLSEIIWNDIIPVIIFIAKEQNIHVSYTDANTIKDLIFYIPPRLLNFILSHEQIPRYDCEEINKAYWDKDGDKIIEIINRLNSNQLNTVFSIIEYFKNIQDYFFSKRIITDFYKTNPQGLKEIEFKLTQIINLLKYLNSDSGNPKFEYIVTIATRSNIKYFISKLKNVIQSTKEVSAHKIRNLAVNVYVIFYFVKKLFDAFFQKEPDHVLLEYFEMIKSFWYYQEFEKSLTDTEIKIIEHKIKKVWDEFITSIKIEELSDLSESSVSELIASLHKLGRPDAYDYSTNSRVNDFLTYLFNQYTSHFPNLSKESFFYCFSSDNNMPKDYPQIIYWKGKKIDFLIFIRSLYQMGSTWTMSDLFVHVKDVKKGRTDWTGGVSLVEKTHSDKVSKIIQYANICGAVFKGDGIPWLRGEKKKK